MPRPRTVIDGSVLVLVGAALAGCASPETQPVTYERALEISREAAQKHGYDLGKYTLDTFGDPAADKDKWLIVYQCVPVPAPPGCSFLVAIDRETGKVEIHPGE